MEVRQLSKFQWRFDIVQIQIPKFWLSEFHFTNQDNNTVSLLRGKGDGTFQPQQMFTVNNRPYAVVSDDFNNDRNFDVAVTNQWDNTISILLGKGDGTFEAQQIYLVGNDPICYRHIF